MQSVLQSTSPTSADTPEKRLELQNQARELLANLQTRINMGATIGEKDVALATRWDRSAAEHVPDFEPKGVTKLCQNAKDAIARADVSSNAAARL